MGGEVWIDIRSDWQRGLSYTEQDKKYHMDPRTAKRYAESAEKPEYTLSAPKATKMDRFKPIVDEWLEETVLLSDGAGVFADAVHRICHGYEYKPADSVPSERVSVLWRVPGGDAVR